MLHGGSVRVLGAGFDHTYPLAAAGWRYVAQQTQNRGYRYRDPKATRGPILKLDLKAGSLGKLVVLGKGAALGLSLATDPQPVDVVVGVGTLHYCMHFGGRTTFHAGKTFAATKSPAPAACPP